MDRMAAASLPSPRPLLTTPLSRNAQPRLCTPRSTVGTPPARSHTSTVGTPFVKQHAPRRRSITSPRAALGSKSLIPSHGYDYYELLGVPPTATHEEIKGAYRRLQKRCHPDVAGREDMAVLLNEAYSALSDPILRFTYDQLRVTWMEDDSFSGKPVYSTWHGSDQEEAAVFVDEVSCIGCLNCAVIATKTFAIECKHGRARAVRQWADDEATINSAILSCPVSCIKLVERSKLAALEHVMSTMPRPSLYALAVGGDGKRVLDVYNETEKFLQKRKKNEKDIDSAREKREQSQSAFDAIRVWWGSRSHQEGGSAGSGYTSGGPMALVHTPHRNSSSGAARASREDRMNSGDGFVPEDLRALHGAASVKGGKSEGGFFSLRVGGEDEEYWGPGKNIAFADTKKGPRTWQAPSAGAGGTATATAPASAGTATATAAAPMSGMPKIHFEGQSGQVRGEASAVGVAPGVQFVSLDDFPGFREEMVKQKEEERNYVLSLLPLLVSVGAGGWAWLAPDADRMYNQAAAMGGSVSVGAAPIPAEVVASAGLRVLLCMVVWYAVGAVVSQTMRLCISAFSRDGT